MNCHQASVEKAVACQLKACLGQMKIDFIYLEDRAEASEKTVDYWVQGPDLLNQREY